MSRYIGYECPNCHKLFSDQDEIVVCPDCGAPYHRACYETAHSCLFTENHSPDFEWMPFTASDKQENTKIKQHPCPQCGAACPDSVRYCYRCGTDFEKAEELPAAEEDESALDAGPDSFLRSAVGSDSIDNIPITEWQHYIGKSAPIYLAVFARMNRRKTKLSLNLSALIFGPIYFFYRKMWKWAILFSLIFLVCNLPYLLLMLKLSESAYAAFLDINLLARLSNVCAFASWAVMLFRGLFANEMYKNDIARQILSIRSGTAAGEARNSLLRKRGGVSPLAALGFIAFVFIVVFLFDLMMGPNLNAVYSLF